MAGRRKSESVDIGIDRQSCRHRDKDTGTHIGIDIWKSVHRKHIYRHICIHIYIFWYLHILINMCKTHPHHLIKRS